MIIRTTLHCDRVEGVRLGVIASQLPDYGRGTSDIGVAYKS